MGILNEKRFKKFAVYKNNKLTKKPLKCLVIYDYNSLLYYYNLF